jgi:hypothetical protein
VSHVCVSTTYLLCRAISEELPDVPFFYSLSVRVAADTLTRD